MELRRRMPALTNLSAVVAVLISGALARGQSSVGNAGPEASSQASEKDGGAPVVLKPGEVPKIVFDGLEHNFPKVIVGTIVYHDFGFSNEGNGPLEILAVKPGCGCTTAGMYDRVVPPGGRGRIPIKVNTDKFSGYINKAVTVLTNCPEPNNAINLSMKGEVWEPVTWMPKTLGFGRVSLQDPKSFTATQTVTILNTTSKPAKLAEPKSNNPNIKGVLKVVEPGKKFEVVASLVPPLQGGVLGAEFEIETGVEEMPKIRVPVSAYLAADIEVFPNRLPLPTNRANDLQRQFSIVNNSANPIKIWEVKSTNPVLKTSIEETRPGMAFKLLLDIPKSYMVAKGGDSITLKTDSTSTPVIMIPIVDGKIAGPTRNEPVEVRQPAIQDPGAEETYSKNLLDSRKKK